MVVSARNATKAVELDGCVPGSAETAHGWYLVGKLARRGAFHANDAEELELAAVAFNRVIDGFTGWRRDRVYFEAVYELAHVEFMRRHYFESMRVYLVLVLQLDSHARSIDPNIMSEVGAMRSLALTEAALMVSDERDWDSDGQVDSVKGLDRPQVIQLFAALDKDERVDLYAALVETANGTASSRQWAVKDCALSRRALDRFHELAPNDPRFEKLKSVVAAC